MEKQDNGEIRANEAGQEADEAVRAAGAPRRGMDRRNFLKGAALSALGVASAGALAACVYSSIKKSTFRSAGFRHFAGKRRRTSHPSLPISRASAPRPSSCSGR